MRRLPFLISVGTLKGNCLSSQGLADAVRSLSNLSVWRGGASRVLIGHSHTQDIRSFCFILWNIKAVLSPRAQVPVSIL